MRRTRDEYEMGRRLFEWGTQYVKELFGCALERVHCGQLVLSSRMQKYDGGIAVYEWEMKFLFCCCVTVVTVVTVQNRGMQKSKENFISIYLYIDINVFGGIV